MILNIEISGVTPLLMHRFIEEDKSVAQDKNLLPREVAERFAYINSENKLYYPAANIFSALIEAGKFHKNGKTKVTTARGSLIPAGASMCEDIIFFSEPDHFEVDSRPVVNPSTGGRLMCHRPRLDNWKLEFNIEVDEKMFSEKTMRLFFDDAGSKIGLGAYRPARKGIYGRFKVTKWQRVG